jgi:hypothetical protein
MKRNKVVKGKKRIVKGKKKPVKRYLPFFKYLVFPMIPGGYTNRVFTCIYLFSVFSCDNPMEII